MFALALALGLLIGLSWQRLRSAQPATSAATVAATLDPQHPPLPAPMAGDPSALPTPMPNVHGAAHIEPTPAATLSVTATATPEPVATTTDAIQTESGNSQAQIIERSQPDYPIEAVRANEEGEVRLQIALDAQGNIDDVRIVQSSHSRALDKAAMDAARKWKFRPAMHDGQPAAATIEVPVQFHLDEHQP